MTITISASNSAVTAPDGSSVLVTGTGDTLSTNNSTIALSGAVLAISGTGNTISLNGVGETLSLTQTGVSAGVTVAEATTAAAAVPEVINASGDAIAVNVPTSNGGAGSPRFSVVTINGSDDTLSLTAGSLSVATFQV
ncbi:MAG: hypothetical protein AB1586_24050, partial [Pseudomonadota bacterium]